ncbi:DNA primase [Candidatus Woesearchaeota archaeon]|nr:DNA primase [Candidatus Woesearchaeota archaeon]
MAKISPVANKYIIHSTINIEGVVDRPDVIGAVFGQTEGLLGADLELRELQRSGKIGRIEVNVNTTSGKTKGEIIIPSSLDKTETAIIGAALEIIQRIGPCNAKVEVGMIEDVRISKRNFVIERAKALLRELTENTLPDSQEIADEVAQSVRQMEVKEYGRDRLAAGPAVEESDEITVVEGRADVLNLLKHGIKNAIAMNGTSVPETIKELSKRKIMTVFVDGDRGGDLIIRELLETTELDFVCKAPDGKEVEEITKKEIHKSLRGKIPAEQAKTDFKVSNGNGIRRASVGERRPIRRPTPVRTNPVNRNGRFNRPAPSQVRSPRPILRKPSPVQLSSEEKTKLKSALENLFGTRGACIFDEKLNVLGKVPTSELLTTIKSVNEGIYAIVLDGDVDGDLVKVAGNLKVKHIVGSVIKTKETYGVNVLNDSKL